MHHNEIKYDICGQWTVCANIIFDSKKLNFIKVAITYYFLIYSSSYLISLWCIYYLLFLLIIYYSFYIRTNDSYLNLNILQITNNGKQLHLTYALRNLLIKINTIFVILKEKIWRRHINQFYSIREFSRSTDFAADHNYWIYLSSILTLFRHEETRRRSVSFDLAPRSSFFETRIDLVHIGERIEVNARRIWWYEIVNAILRKAYLSASQMKLISLYRVISPGILSLSVMWFRP